MSAATPCSSRYPADLARPGKITARWCTSTGWARPSLVTRGAPPRSAAKPWLIEQGERNPGGLPCPRWAWRTTPVPLPSASRTAGERVLDRQWLHVTHDPRMAGWNLVKHGDVATCSGMTHA
jgi:hypothetical protein